jgi:hypothetical protein
MKYRVLKISDFLFCDSGVAVFLVIEGDHDSLLVSCSLYFHVFVRFVLGEVVVTFLNNCVFGGISID